MEHEGNAIAERHFMATDRSGRRLRLVIFAPVLSDDGKNYYCRYAIEGSPERHVREGWGVDGMQALLLAMKMLTADLEFFRDEEFGGELRWDFARATGDLGLSS